MEVAYSIVSSQSCKFFRPTGDASKKRLANRTQISNREVVPRC